MTYLTAERLDSLRQYLTDVANGVDSVAAWNAHTTRVPPLSLDWDDGRAHVEDELRITIADLRSCIVTNIALRAALRDLITTLGDTAIIPPRQLAAARVAAGDDIP